MVWVRPDTALGAALSSLPLPPTPTPTSPTRRRAWPWRSFPQRQGVLAAGAARHRAPVWRRPFRFWRGAVIRRRAAADPPQVTHGGRLQRPRPPAQLQQLRQRHLQRRRGAAVPAAISRSGVAVTDSFAGTSSPTKASAFFRPTELNLNPNSNPKPRPKEKELTVVVVEESVEFQTAYENYDEQRPDKGAVVAFFRGRGWRWWPRTSTAPTPTASPVQVRRLPLPAARPHPPRHRARALAAAGPGRGR